MRMCTRDILLNLEKSYSYSYINVDLTWHNLRFDLLKDKALIEGSKSIDLISKIAGNNLNAKFAR